MAGLYYSRGRIEDSGNRNMDMDMDIDVNVDVDGVRHSVALLHLLDGSYARLDMVSGALLDCRCKNCYILQLLAVECMCE